jgi:hypothetical protein
MDVFRLAEPRFIPPRPATAAYSTQEGGSAALFRFGRELALRGIRKSFVRTHCPRSCRCSSSPQARTVRRQDRRPRRRFSGSADTDRERGHDLNRSLRSVLLRAQLALARQGETSSLRVPGPSQGHRQFCRASSPSRRLILQAVTKIRRQLLSRDRRKYGHAPAAPPCCPSKPSAASQACCVAIS